MQSTKEGYLLTRNVIKIECKRSKILEFIKIHKLMIMISIFFISLVVIEGILLNEFVKLLSLI